jgi:ABC-type lipoprotein release transport system permease subunit
MIWSIAWKNVWRNKKRSLVVIVAVTLGIIAGVLLVGIMEGWTRQRLNGAINNEVSHIQIHNSNYIRNEEIDLTVENLEKISIATDSLKRFLPGYTEQKYCHGKYSMVKYRCDYYGIDLKKRKR